LVGRLLPYGHTTVWAVGPLVTEKRKKYRYILHFFMLRKKYIEYDVNEILIPSHTGSRDFEIVRLVTKDRNTTSRHDFHWRSRIAIALRYVVDDHTAGGTLVVRSNEIGKDRSYD
jgi:hypothetical protein